MKVLKCTIVGDTGVGKSRLLLAAAGIDPGERNQGQTVGVEYGVVVVSPECRVHVWDTAGQERFRSIARAYYRGSSFVMVVFDVCDRHSFDSVSEWVKDVRSVADLVNVPILLVGNKSDKINKQVSLHDATELVTRLGLVGYVETSAISTSENHRQMFIDMASIHATATATNTTPNTNAASVGTDPTSHPPHRMGEKAEAYTKSGCSC